MEEAATLRTTNGYQLGDAMYIQAAVDTNNHMPLRLFVDRCVATLSPGRQSTPLYPIIDYKGCLVDGKSDSNSTFVSPRPKDDVLQFTVDTFRFAEDPGDLIYITCHLKVSAAGQTPDPENKACSFSKATNRWTPVEGTQDICACCETGNCDLPDQSRSVNTWDRWLTGRRLGRDAAAKQGVFSFLQAPGTLVGLILIAIAVILALITLGILYYRKRRSGSY
uniref:Zona pellucida sperm-binding protein 3 n=1 Tax=Varanus komodoensis TaxID=61221 RepID=A0A8D2IU67_VARKO